MNDTPPEAETTPAERVEALRRADATFVAQGMAVEEVADGRVSVSLAIRPDMVNGAGVAHGAWVFMVADTAFGYAATTRLPGALTADADIRFHRPAPLGARIIADAHVVEQTRSSLLIDVTVRDEEGRRIASFRGGARARRR